MAAAVSIAPIQTNSADPAVRRALLMTAEAEAPIAPTNADLEFRSLDLGVLIASEVSPQHVQQGEETTSSSQPSAAPADRVVRLPRASPLPYTFELRQQWEGVVTRIARDEFSVVLRDISATGSPELEAILPIEEVSEEDVPLLAEGAVLYWTIGYEQTLTGQRKRVSIIRFRRLPSWTRKDIARLKERVGELDELFAE